MDNAPIFDSNSTAVKDGGKTMNIDYGGCLTAKQVQDCGDNNPCGLCLSPDGRFLFSVNMESGNIARFIAGIDGGLYYDDPVTENMHIPANMLIMEL